MMLFALMGPALVWAAEPVIQFTGEVPTLTIGKQIAILEDKTNNLRLQDVMSSGSFTASVTDNPNLGVSTSSFWIRFRLQNSSGRSHLLLVLGSPLTDEATLYSVSTDGSISEQKISESLPFSSRKHQSRNYLFDLDAGTEVRTYYIRIKAASKYNYLLQLLRSRLCSNQIRLQT